jgi:hypothetical protein
MCWVFFIRIFTVDLTYAVCIDTACHTQFAAGDQSIVWLLVSTSHIGHHQADCTKTIIYFTLVRCMYICTVLLTQ